LSFTIVKQAIATARLRWTFDGRVPSGLKQSFEDMNTLYGGAYKDYVAGLEGHVKILTKDLSDKTELVEVWVFMFAWWCWRPFLMDLGEQRHADEMRVQEEYYHGKLAANIAMKDSENTKTTKVRSNSNGMDRVSDPID
jgi:hypothetical protein